MKHRSFSIGHYTFFSNTWNIVIVIVTQLECIFPIEENTKARYAYQLCLVNQ